MIKLLADESFKTFSRRYILKNTLKVLENNGKETDYRKYLNHLCSLENYPCQQKDSESKMNFIVSLVNAWYLEKHKDIRKTVGFVDASKKTKKDFVGNDNYHSTKINDRKRLINLMLLNDSPNHQYIELLKELYSFENVQDEEELVYGW